jgi:hypothetical protein
MGYFRARLDTLCVDGGEQNGGMSSVIVHWNVKICARVPARVTLPLTIENKTKRGPPATAGIMTETPDCLEPATGQG